MNINRYNYEEYFILYVDNELDAGGKLEVEAFAEQNPDLKSELDMLMQSKLIPDDKINFSDKGSLMRFQDSSVTLANYEEWLIAYIDDELSPAEKEDAEKFIAGNPSIQRELNLLQRAKLQPEIIEFPGKESLYRKEEKVRKISVTWWRMAAAAVLLFGVSAAGIVLMNTRKGNDAGSGQVASHDPVQSGMAEIDNPVRNNSGIDQNPVTTTTNPKASDQTEASVNKTVPARLVTSGNPPTDTKQGAVVEPNDNMVQDHNRKAENLIADVPSATSRMNELKETVSGNRHVAIAGGTLTPTIRIKDHDPVTPEPRDPYNSGDVASEKSGGGFRGLLRKVTRNIEKRTNIKATDDDDRLLIAGLAIKMN